MGLMQSRPDVTIEAMLDFDPVFALPEFEDHAREIGFAVERAPGQLVIHLVGGDLRVEAAGAATRLTIAAPDAVMLQMLRDYVTEELTAHGLCPEWRGHRAVGQPDSHARARVVASVVISPAYRRVTLIGRDLMRFDGAGMHFRLLLGPKGQGWPMADANGVTNWPGGAAAWHRPVYTTRALRKGTLEAELDFDVFLHEGGRATAWCESVQPGDEIVLAGPTGKNGLSAAPWQGFVGDETAVPVIARMLEDLPRDTRGQAVLVVPCAKDIQSLQHPPGVSVIWALRDSGATPLTALTLLEIPAEGRAVFFAAAVSEADAARKSLAALGLGKSEVTATGYWGGR